VTEDFNALVSAYSAGGAAKEAVQAQIFCTGGTNDGACAANAIERIVSNTINGPAVTTNGFDIFAEYTTEVGPGNLALGFDFSHTLEYTTEAYTKGDTQIAAAFDAAGGLNAGNAVRPLPDLKGRTFAEYNMGSNNFLLYANYLAEYEDQRFAGVNVDSQTTWDFHYQVQLLNDSLQLTASAINFTDEEPPLARVDLNYDGYSHNAFGRMFKLGIQYTLAGG
jgi:choline dehydrogenase-like flavoprotein